MKLIQERQISLRSKLVNPSLKDPGFSVLEVRPQQDKAIKGGLLLMQEIFGINPHIRSLARSYAERGYIVWAPSYFDHILKNVELNYDQMGFTRGRELVSQLGWEQALEDTRTSLDGLRRSLPGDQSRVAVIGFCWGGSLAWLTACRMGELVRGVVSYYGRQSWDFRTEKAKAPVIMHFGEHDSAIPMQNVNEFKEAQPSIPLHLYDAGHGFNCEQRADYNFQAAKLATERTFQFIDSVLSKA